MIPYIPDIAYQSGRLPQLYIQIREHIKGIS